MKSLLLSCLLLVLSLLTANAQTPCDDIAEHPIRFAILGDRTGEHVPGVFGACVEEVARLRPDFVMTVGDAIEGYTADTVELRKEWQEYFQIIEPLKMPVYHTPGNHDITFDAMEPFYRSVMGKPDYSFDHRGVHIIVLDNSRQDAPNIIAEEQLNWLRNDLESHADACYTIVFFHQPFWYRTLGDGKPDVLHDMFKTHGVDAVFNGHFHKYFSAEFDGIKYTAFGSSGGSTEESPDGLLYHFGWVTIDGEGIHSVPIKKGAVLPWDAQRVGDLRTAYLVRQFGMQFVEPLPLGNDLTLTSHTIEVALQNQLPGITHTDTLRWDLPEGWTVEPETFAYQLTADTPLTLPFTVNCSGKLYPLPSLSARLPYMEGGTTVISRTLEVARTLTGTPAIDIVVDGKLSETCWREPLTTLFDGNGNLGERDSVAVYFSYDKDNLYLGVYCHESVMDSLLAELTGRDAAVYAEDAFGLLYQPDPPRGDVYQFYVNPLGTVYDQRISQQSDGYWSGDPSWNGEYIVKTDRGDDFFTIEACIPMSQLGVTIESGETWRVNFRRKQHRLNDSYALQVPWSYDPSTLGALRFK